MTKGQFGEFEENHRELVAIDSQGLSTGEVMDFCKCFDSTIPIPRVKLIRSSSMGAARDV